MRSYMTLAVLALAVSTASPAFSAPVLESEHQARVDIDERGFIPRSITSDIGSLAKVPLLEKRDPSPGSLLGGSLKKLETNKGLGAVVGNGALGGVASAGASSAVGDLLDNDKREPSPFSIGEIFKALEGLVETAVGISPS